MENKPISSFHEDLELRRSEAHSWGWPVLASIARTIRNDKSIKNQPMDASHSIFEYTRFDRIFKSAEAQEVTKNKYSMINNLRSRPYCLVSIFPPQDKVDNQLMQTLST